MRQHHHRRDGDGSEPVGWNCLLECLLSAWYGERGRRGAERGGGEAEREREGERERAEERENFVCTGERGRERAGERGGVGGIRTRKL